MSEEKEQEYDRILEELEVNRQRHTEELKNALRQLIPKEPYKSIYNAKTSIISPEEGYLQADELAAKIANLIYDRMRAIFLNYKALPTGGNFGNFYDLGNHIFRNEPIIKRQMECGDWTVLVYFNIVDSVKKYFENDHNSFMVIHMCKPVDYIKLKGQHNFVRIQGPISGHVNIDPWRSGGKKIVLDDKEYENLPQYHVYKDQKVDSGKVFQYPSWGNKRYFPGEPERKKKR